jgi:hypothetical protein
VYHGGEAVNETERPSSGDRIETAVETLRVSRGDSRTCVVADEEHTAGGTKLVEFVS